MREKYTIFCLIYQFFFFGGGGDISYTPWVQVCKNNFVYSLPLSIPRLTLMVKPRIVISLVLLKSEATEKK